MRLIILGPLRVDTAAQADRLATRQRIPHISTDDIVRGRVTNDTALGLRVSDILAAGGAIPDDIMDQIVINRLTEPDAIDGFLLDGYPRTMPQALALDAHLKERRTPLDAVLQLALGVDEVAWEVAPLARHYAEQGLLVRLDGEGDLAQVAARLVAASNGREPAPATIQSGNKAGRPGSRARLRAVRTLFAALACWPLLGLPLKVVTGEPYPGLYAPSFAIPVGGDGKVPYSTYRLTAVRGDGSVLPVDVKRLFPDSTRTATGIVARRILEEEAATQSPESKKWLRERLHAEYGVHEPRALVVYWVDREWNARTTSTSPAGSAQTTRIDLGDTE